jgi:N-glycosylase/DNA lyase
MSGGAPLNGSPTAPSTLWPVGFKWGDPWQIGTAAFWVDQCQQTRAVDLRLGRSLFEEVVACLLGGWGIPGDIGVTAFKRLQQEGLLGSQLDQEAIELALRQPFEVPGRSRPVRYRFATQRSMRIVRAGAVLADADPPAEPVALRDWLAEHVPGVGLKTASWIVRNLFEDAPVAVVDVHLRRAGLGAGFFDPGWRLPRDYNRFESAFLEVARHGEVVPGQLDHTVWSILSSVPGQTRVVLCGNRDALNG